MAKLRLIPASGAPIEITEDDTLIGRDPSCDIVLPDGSVSRRHARIQRREGGFAVVDQASANGTFLDSQRVADAGLRHGHELRVGAVTLRVEIETDQPDLAATVAGAEPDIEATVVAEAPVTELEDVLNEPPAYLEPPLAEPRFSPPPPPPAGYGPPPGLSSAVDVPAPAGPPGGSMKKPLLWAAGGCCGCLLLILIVAAVVGGFFYFASQEPAKAVRAQLSEIRDGQLEAAYQRLDEPYRAELSKADFEQFVSVHPAVRNNADASFTHRSLENDTAVLAGVLTSRSEEAEPVRFALRKRDGEWKITSIEIDGKAAGSGLKLATTKIDKTRESRVTLVKVTVQVSGFSGRVVASGHEVDLAADLVTLYPDGSPVANLCQENVHRLTRTYETAIEAVDFNTLLRFPDGVPPGDYTATLTFRDLIGETQSRHAVQFALP
jgi:hypothetical protein